MSVNLISAYAPQVGCSQEEKGDFLNTLDRTTAKLSVSEEVWLCGDLNEYVGEGNNGAADVMGRNGFGEKNEWGDSIIGFATPIQLAIVKTFFRKRRSRLITYTSGGLSTQVDCISCKTANLKRLQDCKMLPKEAVARQHKIVLCKKEAVLSKLKRAGKTRRTWWWKINKTVHRIRFVENVK